MGFMASSVETLVGEAHQGEDQSLAGADSVCTGPQAHQVQTVASALFDLSPVSWMRQCAGPPQQHQNGCAELMSCSSKDMY